MSILENISSVDDIKNIPEKKLVDLSSEIREKIIETVKQNGGHLSSNLGIVETTVALYRNFEFPIDKLIFDVGHQCYAHKILSGRYKDFSSIRTKDGLSGFPDSAESEFDPFSVGHAGTSISAGLGLCYARDKCGQNFTVIDVVGDGALTNGLNLEAITSSQEKPKNFIVILNDNGMSISKNKNGLYKYISKHTTGKTYVESKNAFKKIFKNSIITRFFRKIKNLIKRVLNRDSFFELFGFKYVGVIDGNDVSELDKILKRVKYFAKEKAVLLHIKTTKGKGLNIAEEHSDTYHGVGKNLNVKKSSFSEALGRQINELIEKDDKIVAITAAMADGTGLSVVEKSHPDNFIDVGIAEEFAITLSAGMAKGGLRPIIAMYSTFYQRAYDEIMHDVCMQNLPVIFCVDRSGLVGEDGKTHQGVFDTSFLSHIPNLTILSPISESDLFYALTYALSLRSPVAIKYPKGRFEDIATPPFEVEKTLTLKSGKDLSVLAVGINMVNLAREFANTSKLDVGIYAVRVIKPLDEEFLLKIKDKPIIVLEENSTIGGFGSMVEGFYSEKGIKVKLKRLGVLDRFNLHASVVEQMEDNGLNVTRLDTISKELCYE